MKKTITLTAFMALLHGGLATANQVNWTKPHQMQPLPTDYQKTTFELGNQEKQTIQYNQSLIGTKLTTALPQGHVAKSKQYWLDLTGAQLTKGVDLPITSNQVIIRLNPASNLNKNFSLSAQQIEVTQNNTLVKPQTVADAQALKAAGMNSGQHAFALKIIAEPGTLKLKLNKLDKSSSTKRFVINVFEPNSEYELSLTTERQLFENNRPLKVTADLKNHQKNSLPISIKGYISYPNGEKHADLKFSTSQQGQTQATIDKLPGVPMNQGLWEIHTIAESRTKDLTILRDLSSAFAVNLPVAQFNGHLNLIGHQLHLGINTTLASRYEVSTVLTGQNKSGKPQPIALLMSAQWLEKGTQNIALKLPQKLIEKSGLMPPYNFTQLQLKNQSLMTPVQQSSNVIHWQPKQQLNPSSK